jgi:aldehyde dehydrogenase (NAD+)
MVNHTLREPLGVVAGITPWNSPLTLATSKLAPALCAGNTMVIKPSEYTSASVLRLAELVEEAGFPPGTVNVVTGFGEEAGQALVDHPLFAKISFTGRTATGSRIAANVASRFLGSTLELGGKSPNIVFDDADVPNAAMGVVAGVFASGGQTCIAGSRVFAHRSVYDELLERVVERARTIRIGDPLADVTELGPLAFGDQRDKVAGYVDLGRSEGARVLTGGAASDGGGLGGYFYEPTVLVDVDNDMRVVQEEIFGPVVAVMPSTTRTRSCVWPTTPCTASLPVSGRGTSVVRTGWRGDSRPARSGSTPTVRCPPCRRARATRTAASGSSGARRRSTSTRRSRACGSTPAPNPWMTPSS